MRFVVSFLISLCLCACRPSAVAPETGTASRSAPVVQIPVDPNALCSALNEAGLVGSRWKEGAAGFGCVSPELALGPREPGTSVSSSVWFEVRGTEATSATTIVLGGDVRVPEAESAVRNKLAALATLLVKKLNVTLDDTLPAAIKSNAPYEKRIGDFAVRYHSEMVGKVREDRLTIQRAL